MAALKILVCGSVDGQIEKFIKKISNIENKNGPFEMVICSGDFFTSNSHQTWSQVKEKFRTVSVPIYILGPRSNSLRQCYKDADDDGGELTENLFYLGKKGIFKTSSGLSIAYLSGNQQGDNSCTFSAKDVNHLIGQVSRNDKFVGVDLLLTQMWPKDILKPTHIKSSENDGSKLISKLASVLKPRYHFTCHDSEFFERSPYRNHEVLQGNQQHVSRFLSLAPFNNKFNQKGVYAFSMTPLSKVSHNELVKQPDVVTPFPYADVLKTASNDEDTQGSNQFFFNQDDLKRKSDSGYEQGRTKKTPRGPPALKSSCWFCLGSKEVEKHLVISVGEKCYVALAKGALNDDHVLILPIMHHNSTVVSPDDVVMEMEKYKDCLRKMFAVEKKHTVTFERNFYTQHLQLQVVGIPVSVKEEVKDTFMDLACEQGMEMIEVEEDTDLSEMVAVTTPYFLVETQCGERLLHKVKGKMPLQFGREVLSSPSILNLPGRVDWKECKLDREEEIKKAKSFRQRFQKFDFNFQ